MPVTLETIRKASSQDLIDLDKIYLDYPTDFRWQDIQTALQQDKTLKLFGARFNARLLGAISCQQAEGYIELNHLCVRKVTRNRHVARDLLRLLIAQYPSQKIIFNSCIEDEGIRRLLEQAGFTVDNNQYLYQS